MAHEIIMPVLGMAQTMGKIVAWHKAAGDAVKSTDILFEVETDKSTVEVEAGHDGFVQALLSEAGSDVPVGCTIAIISAEKPTGLEEVAAPIPAPPTQSQPALARPAAAATPTLGPLADASAKSASLPTGRILASPKAKRLALERGIDLKMLVARGVRQPIHAGDLESVPAPARFAGTGPVSILQLEARADTSRLKALQMLLKPETGFHMAGFWAAIAAASLRTIEPGGASLIIRVEKAGEINDYVDPNAVRLSQIHTTSDGTPPDLIVRDFTGTRVVRAHSYGETVTVFSLADGVGENALAVSLAFDGVRLPAVAATQLITEFVERVEEPLRRLL